MNTGIFAKRTHSSAEDAGRHRWVWGRLAGKRTAPDAVVERQRVASDVGQARRLSHGVATIHTV